MPRDVIYRRSKYIPASRSKPHLRHQDAAQDANISLVSKLLGHINIETNSRYAHVLTSDLRDPLAGFSVLGNLKNTDKKDTVKTARK